MAGVGEAFAEAVRGLDGLARVEHGGGAFQALFQEAVGAFDLLQFGIVFAEFAGLAVADERRRHMIDARAFAGRFNFGGLEGGGGGW